MIKKSLTNKVILITGASSGIGKALAFQCANFNAHLVLTARNIEALEQLKTELLNLDKDLKILTVKADLTKQVEVEDLIQQAINYYGKVDVLINSAGNYIHGPINELAIEPFKNSIDLNYYGTLYTVLGTLPYMISQKKGIIIIVSSLLGKISFPSDAPYVASKHAVTGFADSIRQELKKTGIRVTAVFPGRIDTPMIRNLKVPLISAKIPPEKVAQKIVDSIFSKKREVYIPYFRGLLLILLKNSMPTFEEWLIKSLKLTGWTIEKIKKD